MNNNNINNSNSNMNNNNNNNIEIKIISSKNNVNKIKNNLIKKLPNNFLEICHSIDELIKKKFIIGDKRPNPKNRKKKLKKLLLSNSAPFKKP
jgi:hypothetical protein